MCSIGLWLGMLITLLVLFGPKFLSIYSVRKRQPQLSSFCRAGALSSAVTVALVLQKGQLVQMTRYTVGSTQQRQLQQQQHLNLQQMQQGQPYQHVDGGGGSAAGGASAQFQQQWQQYWQQLTPAQQQQLRMMPADGQQSMQHQQSQEGQVLISHKERALLAQQVIRAQFAVPGSLR
jgi:hypothetical protein